MKRYLALLLLLGVIGGSVIAEAQQDGGLSEATVSVSGSELAPVTPPRPILTIYDKLKLGHYREGIAAALTLLLFFWRTYGNNFLLHRIPNKFLPLVTTGLGILSRVPILLTSNQFSWDWFVIECFLVSAEAMAFWSVVGKFALPKIFKGKENDSSQAVS